LRPHLIGWFESAGRLLGRSLRWLSPLLLFLALVTGGFYLWWPPGGQPNRSSDLGAALVSGSVVALALFFLETQANRRSEKANRQDLQLTANRQDDLTGIDLSGSNLAGFLLREKDLTRANLRRAVLRQAQLERSDLTQADLRGADLREANLQGANLRGANMSGTNLDGAAFRDAVADAGTIFPEEFDPRAAGIVFLSY
jgi:Pentapeptide repeats (8 copies)